MANEEHLKILEKGVKVWNQWRRDHFITRPDLSGADLSNAKLSGVMLNGASLIGAHFCHADLSRSDFSRSELNDADLSDANFYQANANRAALRRANLRNSHLNSADFSLTDLNTADMRNADLRGSQLRGARLSNANLGSADLRGSDLYAAYLDYAYLIGAKLNGTKVKRAIVNHTVFDNIDLCAVNGLDSITHEGPSELSISTINLSKGQIPEIFLRGCGLRDWEIENTKLYRTDLSRNEIVDITYKLIELRSDPLLQFNSCFISYSSNDEEFAKRIYSDLQGIGVRCWFAPAHMKIGDRIRRRIDDSIRVHDKLLLVLSETSVLSQWIEQEVATALEKEREQGCDVLFPVRLDDTIMKVRSDWPALIRNTRHIGDFRRWNDPCEYEWAFRGLLDDLRVEAKTEL
jgi:uncharacterized protein YjbI with pentapeptide repeats